ncbi:zinc-binding dehydrogenase [Chelativorans sp. ZYF759]|uniref:alcohol dehydrogenase catalytic domain-containing protein n=1 Tax=Chelativorans sp. ZYF759 TaxID=2692213 RepID=UPI00145CEC98|nr:zinc-binding dehydrogenase [Chelativorans sp. ZYF759]NMG39170.1 zinc-binding dehydrogenase [Chelativorans sp. ZYF759]
MNVPTRMKALLQKHDGYATEHSGVVLEAMAPYLEQGEIALPQPGEGQLLIKVSLAAVNPSDVMFVKGLYGQPRQKGRPPGFEGVGEVVAAGPDKESQALIGKRVAFATGRSGSGSWAEYAIADARAVIPVIDQLRDEDAAAFIVNPLTALAMFDLVREEGAKSFILSAAASQLCKLMMRAARDEGFRPIALVRRDDDGHLAEAGAAHVLNVTAPDFEARLAAVLKEEKPRVFLDAVTGKMAGQVFNAMGRGARWVIYGRMDSGDTVIPEPGQLIFMGKRIEGFWLTEWMGVTPTDRKAVVVMEAQKRFADGRWQTDVTAIVPLAEAMDRLPQELEKPDGKVFVAP